MRKYLYLVTKKQNYIEYKPRKPIKIQTVLGVRAGKETENSALFSKNNS